MTSAVSMILTASFLLSGCGKQEVLEDAYNVYDTTSAYGMDASVQEQNVSYFADNLCVTGTDNILTEGVTENLSEAAGLFDTVNHEVKYLRKTISGKYH